MVGRRPEPGLLLLRDLRELHLAYAEASINGVILGQGAPATKEAADVMLPHLPARARAVQVRGDPS